MTDTPQLLDCGHRSSQYGTTADDKRHCYDCCAEMDRQEMIEKGKITLYLTKLTDAEWEALRVMAAPLHPPSSSRYKITNWPGTLKFQPHAVTESVGYGFGSEYPIVYAYFRGPDGKIWVGRNAGRGELACCRRAKA